MKILVCLAAALVAAIPLVCVAAGFLLEPRSGYVIRAAGESLALAPSPVAAHDTVGAAPYWVIDYAVAVTGDLRTTAAPFDHRLTSPAPDGVAVMYADRDGVVTLAPAVRWRVAPPARF